MELIPYTSREGRDIVLRHRNALVVRDPASQRLEIRGATLTECPTCHRPLRSSSPERHFDASAQHDSYVDPNYFRMLQAGHNADEQNTPHPPPSSPIRRLAQPTLPSGDARIQGVRDAEFVSSSPAPHEGARIRRDAFSPNYFKRFFVEERELGRGGKGVVLLVRHQIDGYELGHFACKRVPVGDDHAWLEKVLIEVELLAKLSHPNLVSYRHVWLEDVKLHRFGPTVACAFILQQYCNNGDLLRYVIGESPKEVTKEQLKEQMRRRSKGRLDQPQGLYAPRRYLPFEEIYSLFRDVTSGLAYLHGANYIHRDLKPSNCLLHRENGNLTCLISDFGEVQPGNAIRKSTGTTGTISYCAPEVLKQDTSGRFGNFTTKSDVFSLGMILYFLCFGRLPYQSANSAQEELEDIDELRAEITDWKGFLDEKKERPDLPAKLYQLLKKMLALNPAQRPSTTEVLSAMNHESNNLHSGSRSTSPHIGLHNRRIQSLDSPMPPGTPVPDPLKHNRDDDMDMATEDDFTSADDDNASLLSVQSPQSSSQNILQKYPAPSTPRHRPQALALSRGQDELVRSSPTRARALGTTNHSQPSPGIHTPLLIAPPPDGPLGTLRQQAVLSQHQLSYFLGSHGDSILFIVKFVLFLVKMASLAKVCWPFMVNLGVGVPLICIAGIDLAIPSYRGMVFEGREGPSHALIPAESFRRRWGWRITFSLLIFHCLALWVVSQWGALCAATHDDWLYW
ncbi:kinase-like domain-containing protein [Biscogniauxia mediterranea]|nr:kinase-like domain-containing protein [Biscogniauxia mediterranea]